MLLLVDPLPLLLRVPAPQNEDHVAVVAVDCLDHRIREILPAFILVRVCIGLSDAT